MQESMIFLSSSRYESFGLASAEARACGCATFDPKPLLDFISSTKYNSNSFSINDSCPAFNTVHAINGLDPRHIAESFLSLF